jgi:hypothetical protein
MSTQQPILAFRSQTTPRVAISSDSQPSGLKVGTGIAHVGGSVRETYGHRFVSLRYEDPADTDDAPGILAFPSAVLMKPGAPPAKPAPDTRFERLALPFFSVQFDSQTLTYVR